MVKMTFDFESPEAAFIFLSNAIMGTPPPSTEEYPAPPSTKPVRGRKAKEEKAAKASQPILGLVQGAVPTEPTEPASFTDGGAVPPPMDNPKAEDAATAPTSEAVRTALRAVFNGPGGAKAATEILKQFAATRITEIKPDQYAAFINACGK